VLGEFQPVAMVGGATGLSNATFSVIKDPVLAEDGGLAFPATITGQGIKGVAAATLWWQPPGAELQLLAQGGQQASSDLPAGVVWRSFTSLAIAANRGPIFEATLVPGRGGVTAANDRGVWATDLDGKVRLLFRTGDRNIAAKKTLKSFQILHAAGGTRGVTRSFNDNQEVIWRANFTDGTEAVVTTEVP
jgi:hypothetical protein